MLTYKMHEDWDNPTYKPVYNQNISYLMDLFSKWVMSG